MEQIPADQGRVRVVVVPDPAAAGDFTYTQPICTRWRLISVGFEFQTSGTAANRLVQLDIMMGTEVLIRSGLRGPIIASRTIQVSYFGVVGYAEVQDFRSMTGSLPEKMLLNNEMVIRTVTTNIQVGDQFSHIRILVEEWIEPLV